MYQQATLNNGIRVVTHDLKDRDSAAIGILVGVGGRSESDRIKGAAHFLEHIVFKGSKKYSCAQIKERVEGVGGSLNAFTGEERTCYYAKVPAPYVEQAFDVLADMFRQPLIRKNDMEKERTVICEEIKMYHDLPQYQVMDNLDRIMWPDHPLGMSLTGTLESVGKMTTGDLRDFHRSHYVTDNVIIAACGKVRHRQIEQMVNRMLKKTAVGQKVPFVPASNIQAHPRFDFNPKPTEQMHLALGTLGLDYSHPDKYALTLLHIILGGNMSSRLFTELRERRGLAYSISSGMKCLQDTGIFLVRAGVDNQKLVPAAELILKTIHKMTSGLIPDAEFRRARDYYLGQVLLGMEDTLDHMLWLADSLMSRDRLETRADIFRAVRRLTPSDIRRVARMIFSPERLNLALIGPLNDSQDKDLRRLFLHGR